MQLHPSLKMLGRKHCNGQKLLHATSEQVYWQQQRSCIPVSGCLGANIATGKSCCMPQVYRPICKNKAACTSVAFTWPEDLLLAVF